SARAGAEAGRRRRRAPAKAGAQGGERCALGAGLPPSREHGCVRFCSIAVVPDCKAFRRKTCGFPGKPRLEPDQDCTSNFLVTPGLTRGPASSLLMEE